jgi:hypothetical protein
MVLASNMRAAKVLVSESLSGERALQEIVVTNALRMKGVE